MPAKRKAVAFIRSNRKDFEELKTPVPSIAAIRRIGEGAGPWYHYEEFFDPFDMGIGDVKVGMLI